MLFSFYTPPLLKILAAVAANAYWLNELSSPRTEKLGRSVAEPFSLLLADVRPPQRITTIYLWASYCLIAFFTKSPKIQGFLIINLSI